MDICPRCKCYLIFVPDDVFLGIYICSNHNCNYERIIKK